MAEIRSAWSSSYDWWLFLSDSKLSQRSSNGTDLDHKREQQSFFKRSSRVTDSTFKPSVYFLVFIAVNTREEELNQIWTVQRSHALIRGRYPQGQHVTHEGSAPLSVNSRVCPGSQRPRRASILPCSLSSDPPTADTRHHLRDSIILGVDVQPSAGLKSNFAGRRVLLPRQRITSTEAETNELTSSRSSPRQADHHEQVGLQKAGVGPREMMEQQRAT